MRRTLFVTGVTSLAATLILASCSGNNTGDVTDTTLSFFTDKAAWESSFDDINDAAEGSSAQLDFTGYSDPDAYDAFIKQSFRTKELPDLFTWHTGDQLAELVEEGVIAETTDLWDEAIDDGIVDEELAENYTFDGEQYCVPFNVVYWVMYYNKDVFDEYDLQEPETWDEFEDIADTLVDNNVTPLHQMDVIFEFVWFQALLGGKDPDKYMGLSDGSVSYTDPTVVEAMDKWHEMQSNDYFIEPGIDTDPEVLLKEQDVAMAYFGTFFTGQLTEVGMESGEDYGTFILPSVNDELPETPVAVETGPLCVAADSDNKDAALEYSKWWMSDEAQSTWSESRGDVSFNPNASISDDELAEITELATSDETLQLPRWLEATPNDIYTVAS